MNRGTRGVYVRISQRRSISTPSQRPTWCSERRDVLSAPPVVIDGMNSMTDWNEWHADYTDPLSLLSERLRIVQRHMGYRC